MCDHIKFDNANGCINVNKNELKNAPNKTNNPNNPDANNGLITSIWGPPTWESFHSITFGYPIKPSEEQKKDYMEYFRLLGKVLPCVYCRVSYDNFITDETNKTLLNMDTMKSRETLTKWGMYLHDAVNNKLGVNYGTLVGHSTVRRDVIGEEARDLTESELEVFKKILKESFDGGALGMSTGLGHVLSQTVPHSEIKDLLSVVANKGKVYTTHLRNEQEREEIAENGYKKVTSYYSNENIINYLL